MNYQNLILLVLLAAPVACVSLTLTRSMLFKGFREWVGGRSDFFGELVRCPFCTSHWVAFVACAIFKPWVVYSNIPVLGIVLQFFISSLILVAMAMLIAGAVYKAVAGMG